MSTVEAEITLTDDGATVRFEDAHGKPVRFSSPREEWHMLTKTLRTAAEEARHSAEAVNERELVTHYQRCAERLEKELKRIGG